MSDDPKIEARRTISAAIGHGLDGPDVTPTDRLAAAVALVAAELHDLVEQMKKQYAEPRG